MKQICKRKQSTKNILGPIRALFAHCLDAQRTHITMDFLQKTNKILNKSGKQVVLKSHSKQITKHLNFHVSGQKIIPKN